MQLGDLVAQRAGGTQGDDAQRHGDGRGQQQDQQDQGADTHAETSLRSAAHARDTYLTMVLRRPPAGGTPMLRSLMRASHFARRPTCHGPRIRTWTSPDRR
ncbi:hypothetical protein SSP35_08_00770 [Streptomyces sp. NBRC 110611]|nr:hypothetical protein SSP35_08_00770 [Streptomyces sp. NBRC 110611]